MTHSFPCERVARSESKVSVAQHSPAVAVGIGSLHCCGPATTPRHETQPAPTRNCYLEGARPTAPLATPPPRGLRCGVALASSGGPIHPFSQGIHPTTSLLQSAND